MGDLQTRPKSQMSDEERVRDFQRKLYQKAKQDETFRFYVLYDKVRLLYFLRESYKRCKANRGSAGVDGMTFMDVETYGIDKFLAEIVAELESKTYKPQPVLRVYIPESERQDSATGNSCDKRHGNTDGGKACHRTDL